jgi:cytochrome b561
MGLNSTADRYGTMILSIHWVLKFHIPLALAVLGLTVWRIVWWWGFDRKPKPVVGSPYWQERLARECISSSTS